MWNRQVGSSGGNPAVQTQVEADAELQRLAILRKCWMEEQ
jgi:hypothetical protein